MPTAATASRARARHEERRAQGEREHDEHASEPIRAPTSVESASPSRLPSAEEVDEEAERRGRRDGEHDRARAFGRRSAPLLDRREHRAAERGDARRASAITAAARPSRPQIANGTTAPQATSGETTLIVPSESAR